jgi:dimethylamine/trimethylamine dehydrogenase
MYERLFQPLKIGPVTTRNRFYQLPHGCGFGYRDPSAMTELRRVKAEGGWGVVCTEQTEIHPTSDMTPYVELRAWDDADIPVLAAVANAVHEFGSLAAIELSHSGANTSNWGSRELVLAASDTPTQQFIPAIPEPTQGRGMSKREIGEFRQWHRAAARRGVQAGFDIVYVYASQLLGLPHQFLSRKFNRRTDEYGGTIANRLRLLRELIEDTLEVANNRAAVAVRLTIDELLDPDRDHADLAEVFGLIGELPDLWDIVISGWGSAIAGTARFDFDAKANEPALRRVRSLTTKPIVSVRFFPTADEMLRLVEEGVVDLIGCARQSIADPFLPEKIRNGQLDQIRECIKCNICIAGELSSAGLLCTQNPSFGEEWRRGWHPERYAPKGSDARILVVGAGPAGLECAHVLGARGYDVALCDQRAEAGGRVLSESKLPGLGKWRAVADYRTRALAKMPSVSVRLGARLEAEEILTLGFEHVVLATGAHWRRDGLDRRGGQPRLGAAVPNTYTPDDIFAGNVPDGTVLVYDDDHYFVGSSIAETLARSGCKVIYVTPAPVVAAFTFKTMEQRLFQRNLMELGVTIVASTYLNAFRAGSAGLECAFTGAASTREADGVVLVTSRIGDARLFDDLMRRDADLARAGVRSVRLIGDAERPGLIAQAVWSGHRYGREADGTPQDVAAFKRDVRLPASRLV